MRITVRCECGTRVRATFAQLRSHPPCPSCGEPLPNRPEKKETRRIPFHCGCGLEMRFPYERGGMWFDCPQCGRRSVIQGRGASLPKPIPVDLPDEKVSALAGGGAKRVPVLLLIAIGAILVALGIVLLA
jgi:predicted RNA-binding Zn-ribbon protein involved in translation (DUF1610 family)